MNGNEHGQLQKDTIYAKLVNVQTGVIEISATLEYILSTIRDRDLNVEGVIIEHHEQRGAMCTSVKLSCLWI